MEEKNEEYDEDILVALIINFLVKKNDYEKDELNGIRKFFIEYIDKENIKKIANKLGVY